MEGDFDFFCNQITRKRKMIEAIVQNEMTLRCMAVACSARIYGCFVSSQKIPAFEHLSYFDFWGRGRMPFSMFLPNTLETVTDFQILNDCD